MAKLWIVQGSTNVTQLIKILDSTSTVGAGLTGLAWNDSGLSWYYYREIDGTGATQVTLATATLGTWATGGFIEVDAADMPGWYEISIPNAVIAAGAEFVGMQLKGATNMAETDLEIQLTVFDPNATQIVTTDIWSDGVAPVGQNNIDALTAAMIRAVSGIAVGTVSGTPTTTNIPTSSLLPAAIATDQFKGRIITFADNTTTVALRGQSTDITSSSTGGVFTVTALTTAPVSGDIFTIQ